MVFGALLVVAQAKQGPLDDPDPAEQRPGFLDADGLPIPAPTLTNGLPRSGHRAVVFFVRPQFSAELCRGIGHDRLGRRADVAVVVSGPGQCPVATTVSDPAARLSHAYGLRRPRGGGAPVGYAVVDSRGQVRYRTLDPSVAQDLSEIDTILGSTP